MVALHALYTTMYASYRAILTVQNFSWYLTEYEISTQEDTLKQV